LRLDNSRTLVTGGASFIGSHLVEQLVGRVASLRVVDDLSSGRVEYLQADGLHRTIDWYFDTKDRTEVAASLEASLIER
jgi:nucleoside-diphosphate-sugar epimerase